MWIDFEIIKHEYTKIGNDKSPVGRLKLATIHPNFLDLAYVIKTLTKESRKTSNILKGVYF